MRIDAASGVLTFAAGAIEPRQDRTTFLSMPIAKTAEAIPGGPGWRNFRFVPEPEVFASAYFLDDRLRKVSLALALPGEIKTPWGSSREQERKAHHEAWLRSQLGRPPYIYVWGEIFASTLLWTNEHVIDVDYVGPLDLRGRLKRRLRHWMSRLQEID